MNVSNETETRGFQAPAFSIGSFWSTRDYASQPKSADGFSLIEMMIVVAIIAVLSAIALVSYQNFTIRSQVNAGLSDIRGGMTAFEEAVTGRGLTVFDHSDIGLSTTTPRCEPIGLAPGQEGFLDCTLIGHPAIRGGVISLSRSSTSGWSCSITGVDDRHFPDGCR